MTSAITITPAYDPTVGWTLLLTVTGEAPIRIGPFASESEAFGWARDHLAQAIAYDRAIDLLPGADPIHNS